MRNMKDSGIEWIGEIPEDWDVIKTKNRYSSNKEIVGNMVDKFDRLALTLNGVIKRGKDDSEGLQPEKFEGYQILRENELVFKLIDLENIRTSRVGLSSYTGIVSPAYIVLNNEYESKFGYYYFLSMWQREIFNKLGGDGVRSNLNTRDLLNIPYINIPMEEQREITEYLDLKVSQIDNIISKTKETVEEYKKYKQSVITEAVTKGVNPNVEMKYSGIEWIGEIPVDWELTKLKKITKSPLQYGANSSGVEYDSKLPRYIRITDIDKNNELKTEGKLSLQYDEAQQYILKDGDILFARSGGTVGKTFLYKESYGISAFAGYLIKASIIDDILPTYIYYYTLSSSYNEWKNRIFIQATIQNIGADKYSNMEIPIPKNKNEQEAVVEYLDMKCNKIDNIISKKEQLITELEQYKKSLIYECVTGKKEVSLAYAD